MRGHGGELALEALAGSGIAEMFTLSGGHVFPLYDAAVKTGMPIYDVRHEQTAVFAADATARLTRRPGLAVVTAGPGVTNSMSAVATAAFVGSPLVVLAGRAAETGWGRGSLQELDHVPLMAPLTKHAATVKAFDSIASEVGAAVAAAARPHRGPVFVDLPIDVIFAEGEGDLAGPGVNTSRLEAADFDESAAVQLAALLARAERPALLVGGDVYWGEAWEALAAAADALRVPVFANGLGRGCLPANHELSFSRTRALLKSEADLVVVVGTPLDFRVGFGRFGEAQVAHVVDHPDQLAGHAELAVGVAGDIAAVLTALADHRGQRVDHQPWIDRLRSAETAAREVEEQDLLRDSDPIAPARIYGELRRFLDRDAVILGDGGDFVSYAGKHLDSYLPGRWLDPGPFGCLGTAMGFSMAARIAHPDSQVCTLLGDGAAGFSLMDVDSLVRHNLPVVMVVGNNGMWGLEKHPMQAIYGYDVAAELQPECRYDQVVEALGGAGEVVRRADEIRPALERAFASGVPYLLNVLTDPADAYPRTSQLG